MKDIKSPWHSLQCTAQEALHLYASNIPNSGCKTPTQSFEAGSSSSEANRPARPHASAAPIPKRLTNEHLFPTTMAEGPSSNVKAFHDDLERLFRQDNLLLRLVQVLEHLVLPASRVVFAKLRDERHAVAHVHGAVPVLGRLKERIQLIRIDVHVLDLVEDLLDLKQGVGRRSQS
mmetsp:Transcript_27993/g.52113  ORF Transcript_27993/g.52113 Transcript_27993/m.52113 type:complete len:175 (+) Transcript_27993:120-644(+)